MDMDIYLYILYNKKRFSYVQLHIRRSTRILVISILKSHVCYQSKGIEYLSLLQ